MTGKENIEHILKEFENALRSLDLSWETIDESNLEKIRNIITTAHRMKCKATHPDKIGSGTFIDFRELGEKRDYLLSIIENKKLFKQIKQIHDKNFLQSNLIIDEKFKDKIEQELAKNPRELKKIKKAEEAFKKGNHYKDKNDIDSAIDQYKKAVKKNPAVLVYAIALAETLYSRHSDEDYNKAKKVLLAARQSEIGFPPEQEANLYYLLAVIEAKLEPEKAQAYLQHAESLTAEPSNQLASLIQDAIAVLNKKQIPDPLTSAFNKAENNIYSNPYTMPNYEQQFSNDILLLLTLPETSAHESLEKIPEGNTASEKNNQEKQQSLIALPSQQLSKPIEHGSILANYIDHQLYHNQLQILANDINLNNLQNLQKELNAQEESLLEKTKDVEYGLKVAKDIFILINSLIKVPFEIAADSRENIFIRIWFGLHIPLVPLTAPLYFASSLIFSPIAGSVVGLYGLGQRANLAWQLRNLRKNKENLNIFIEQLQTTTQKIIKFTQLSQQLTSFGSEEIGLLNQIGDINPAVEKTKTQLINLVNLLEPFGGHQLTVILAIRWGDYHLWAKNLFASAAEYYQKNQDTAKANELMQNVQKHTQLAIENFDRAMQLVSASAQLLPPLILVNLVSTLFQYWHFQYQERFPTNNVQLETERVQHYRQFIFEKLQALKLQNYFRDLQNLLVLLPYFNSRYIDRQHFLQIFKIICTQIKVPELSRDKKFIKNNIKLITAVLPHNRKKITLTEEIIVGDGNCGFNAMGIDRQQLIDTLSTVQDQPQARNFLGEEILNEFKLMTFSNRLTAHFPQYGQWRELFDEYLKAEEKRNKAAAAMHHKFKLPQETRIMSPLELTQYLQKNPQKYGEDLGELIKLNKIVEDANQALLNFCLQPQCYVYYIKLYESGLWLGCYSALLYAKIKNIDLYIWEQASQQEQLKLKHYHLSQDINQINQDSNNNNAQAHLDAQAQNRPAQSIHLLFTGNFTHFNLLIDVDKKPDEFLAYQLLIKDYHSLLQLFPNSSNLHNDLGTFYEKQGRLQKAKYHYQQAFNLDPEAPLPLANLNRLEMLEGNYKGAVEGFEMMYDSHLFHRACPELKPIQNPYVSTLEKELETEPSDVNFLNTKNQPKPTYKILSVDGGGIRGIIPAMILQDIEQEIEQPISSSFDLLTGTSTGGIISLGLTCPAANNFTPKYTANDVVAIYTERGRDIFAPSMLAKVKQVFAYKYNPTGLEILLQEYFGTANMGQALAEVIVPTYCLTNNQPYFISKHEYRLMPIWQAARCTSAAPTYFPPAEFTNTLAEFSNKRFIDGGVYENNPVMCGVTYALKQNYHLSDLYVVSLGTGNFMPPLHDSDRGIINRGGITTYADKIFNIASNGISQSYHLKMHGLFSTKKQDNRYHRINIELARDIPLDNVSNSAISELCSLGREAIEENRDALREICMKIK